MSLFHLIFGILIFIVFLVTRKFMRVDFPDKEIIPQDLRILMRSRHIYILFSALLHLLLGAVFQLDKQLWRKFLQVTGSVLLTLSSILFVWAFIDESYFTQHFSEISRWGIYLSLAGVLFHVLGNMRIKAKN